LDIFADIGEGLMSVLQTELEMNHEYCQALQGLRHEIRHLYETRGGADRERERQRERQRREQALREARQNATVRTIMRH
jgi:hypothetical protein